MRYFENPNDANRVYGYDSQDATQAALLQTAISGKWKEVTGAWPPAPTLNDVKIAKLADLSLACKTAIEGGFTSSALGTVNTYDSAIEDQVNLAGAAALGAASMWRCANAQGVKVFVQHTAAQLKQVAADGAAFKLAKLQAIDTLRGQVNSAITIAAVNAIVWV